MAAVATETIRRVEAGASPDERAALGKSARAEVPRSSHGEWEPAADRADPVELLERQAEDRVAELIPLRYGRMLASSFTFYRGAAAIMAADLAPTPSSGLWVQACGDAHLSNFGAYAAPDRTLVIDVNDFDETLPAPWEWDIKRLAASLEIAGRDRGFEQDVRRRVVLAGAGAYRVTMCRLAELGNLDVWYERLHVSDLREAFEGKLSKSERNAFERNVAKARRKDRLRAFSKLTHRVDGELRIKSDPPVLVPFEELFSGDQRELVEDRVREVLEGYRDTLSEERRHLLDGYRYVHAARKVVGVGSVGTRAYVALYVGRDEGDPLFLQVKEAQGSVLEPYAAPSAFPHHGQRVVMGQRLIQAASDILLGWLSAIGPDDVQRQFYVRQLWDQKGSATVELMSPARLAAFANICGSILARAHARSGDRIAIASYLGSGDKFDRAMAAFAGVYADQNERDFKALSAAVRDGRIGGQPELE